MTNYSLRDLFNNDFTKRVAKYEEVFPSEDQYLCFEYKDKDKDSGSVGAQGGQGARGAGGKQKAGQGFDGEVKTFVGVNYDLTKYKSF